MVNNPYDDAEELANLLWEAEMVADRHSNGGLIFIRTAAGWRAFLGSFTEDALSSIEKSFDNNTPSYRKEFSEGLRESVLTEEIMNLLTDCVFMRDYYPNKFRFELDEDFEN